MSPAGSLMSTYVTSVVSAICGSGPTTYIAAVLT
jgi:hypothetical protein